MLCLVSLGDIRLLFPQESILSIASATDVDRSLEDHWMLGHYRFEGESIPVYELSDNLFPRTLTQRTKQVGAKDFCLLFRGVDGGEHDQSGFGLVCDKIESLDTDQSTLTHEEIPTWMSYETLGLDNIYRVGDGVVFGCDAPLLSASIDRAIKRGDG